MNNLHRINKIIPATARDGADYFEGGTYIWFTDIEKMYAVDLQKQLCNLEFKHQQGLPFSGNRYQFYLEHPNEVPKNLLIKSNYEEYLLKYGQYER